jgi:hypothetical protein
MSNKTLFYTFLQQKYLTSLFISKETVTKQSIHFGLMRLHLVINTTKIHDVNLLTINALWFLLLGQYPKSIMQKSLMKYRKSKISFLITLSKSTALYTLCKLIFLSMARQVEFTGYLLKTALFFTPIYSFSVGMRSLPIFYMVEYLYGQQGKSILTVKQKVTINVTCGFLQANDDLNLSFLRSVGCPLKLEDTLVPIIEDSTDLNNTENFEQ